MRQTLQNKGFVLPGANGAVTLSDTGIASLC